MVARTGICKSYGDTARTSCEGFGADQVCGTPFDSIRAECIAVVKPVTDGGTDSGLDAADGGG